MTANNLCCRFEAIPGRPFNQFNVPPPSQHPSVQRTIYPGGPPEVFITLVDCRSTKYVSVTSKNNFLGLHGHGPLPGADAG